MDQHPIPQDVTGFQFKLIGSMTVKQFAYVAAGVITAVILYYLPLKMSFAFLLKTLLIPLFGVSGVVIAFVPIDGRPIDVMASNFFRALFSPNQYIYRKTSKHFSFTEISIVSSQSAAQQNRQTAAASPPRQQTMNKKELQLQAILHGSDGKVKNKLDEKEMAFLKSFSASPAAVTQPAQQPSHPPLKLPPAQQHSMLAPMKTTQQAQVHAASPLPPLAHLGSQSTQTGTHPAAQPPAQPITPAAQAKTQPVQTTQSIPQFRPQIAAVQPQSVAAPAFPSTQLRVQTQPPANQTFLRTGTASPQQLKPAPPPPIPLEHAKNITLPHVADVPNVVTGIVRDPRGNVLPNILVEVKDRDGNPIRAFKTNGLGHFASATPLSYGMYTIELEDPKKQHTFGLIQLNANNHIMQPIEIVSHDAREQLRQELFN